jgi:hypothetical protein
VSFDPFDVVKIVNSTNDSIPLSSRLYDNIQRLTGDIRQEISRGIASAMPYADIARNVAGRGGIALRNAQRIAQTEGHRVAESASFDAMTKAKAAGADIVKQWDSAMDARTRPTHIELDGQIREIDEPFEAKGHKALYPGGFGIASEDINCRCVALQRPRWAVEGTERYMTAGGQGAAADSFNEFKAQQKDKEIFPFADAQLDEFAESGNSLEQFNKIAKSRWGTEPLDDSLSGLDRNTLDKVLATIDRQMATYPQMKGRLHSVSLGGVIKDAYALTSNDGNGLAIKLGRSYFLDPEKIAKEIGERGVEEVLVHELGHVLQGILQTTAEWNAKPSAKKLSSQVVKEALDGLGYEVEWNKNLSRIDLADQRKTLGKLREEISAGANSKEKNYDNDSELLSESLVYVWYNGIGKNELADAVYNALLRRLG